jgi:ribonuclease Z
LWGSLLIEVGNTVKVLLLRSRLRALANFSSLLLSLESTTKVFLSQLHADHIGDIRNCWEAAEDRPGRPDGDLRGRCDDQQLGLHAFVKHISKAMAWDRTSLLGLLPTTGAGRSDTRSSMPDWL